MKKILQMLSISLLLGGAVLAQTANLQTRTVYKTDRFDFGSGGTLSIIGAPTGSIRIEGWNNNEVEMAAEIEIQAANKADLDMLERVTTVVLDDSAGRVSIISTGTHEKKYLKSIKKFPKNLVGLPFKIDYVIKVPRYCDLLIDGGKGNLFVGGVDGTMTINFLDTKAEINLVGGGLSGTFGDGSVAISIPTRSWRGRFVDVQMAKGTLDVGLPAGLNAQVDASILRTGSIVNTFTEFKPRSRKVLFTDKQIEAKAGVGGVPLKFSVGDGTMNIFQTK